MIRKPQLHKRHFGSKKRNARNGIVTIEFALCLPLMALISFGSIQISSSIVLRHKTVAILETGTLAYMLGKTSESGLKDHIESLSEEFALMGSSATVTRETIDNVNFLRVKLTVPLEENIVAPIFVAGPPDISSSVLIYRP